MDQNCADGLEINMKGGMKSMAFQQTSERLSIQNMELLHIRMGIIVIITDKKLSVLHTIYTPVFPHGKLAKKQSAMP